MGRKVNLHLPLLETALLRVCVSVCVYISVCSGVALWLLRLLRGTVAMETGPGQCCVTAAVPQAGEVGGSDGPVTSGDEGGWRVGGEGTE